MRKWRTHYWLIHPRIIFPENCTCSLQTNIQTSCSIMTFLFILTSTIVTINAWKMLFNHTNSNILHKCKKRFQIGLFLDTSMAHLSFFPLSNYVLGHQYGCHVSMWKQSLAQLFLMNTSPCYRHWAPVFISKRFDVMKLSCIIFNRQCGLVIYGGTMLPGCGKKHNNLSAGSPFEVHIIYMSSIIMVIMPL